MTSQSGVGQTRIVLQFGHADLPTSLQAFGSSIRFPALARIRMTWRFQSSL